MRNLKDRIDKMFILVKGSPLMRDCICVISDISYKGKEIQMLDDELRNHKFSVLYIQGNKNEIEEDINELTDLLELKRYCTKKGYSLGALPGNPKNPWVDEE